ncbi:MAG: hypothetical protein PSY14_11615 [bacterium]|nr:hypothetical protein [bacterium]
MAEAGWQKTLKEFTKLYEQIQATDDRVDIPAAVSERITAATAGWDANRFVFTFGQLDAEKSAHLARAGVIQWWYAHTGHGYFGDVDGMRVIHGMHATDAGLKNEAIDASSALSWACFPHSVTAGEVSRMNADVVKQLFDWGAKHDHEKSKYYKFALDGSPQDVIAAFIAQGADAGLATTVMTEKLAKKDYAQAMRIQQALGLDGFYTKIDSTTIMQTKFIMTPLASALKTIFNFGARRINEIYETGVDKDAVMTMTSSNFEQYDSGAVRRAQETLEKMGGNPPDVLDKPKLSAMKNG